MEFELLRQLHRELTFAEELKIMSGNSSQKNYWTDHCARLEDRIDEIIFGFSVD